MRGVITLARLRPASAPPAADRLQWLTRLAQDGIAFLTGVPAPRRDPRSVWKRWAVAETNYGLLFEVRSVAQPENLAFSDHGLGLHTDNPYREPGAGFQALHVLVSSPDGGENLFGRWFCDRGAAAHDGTRGLLDLTSTPVPFQYRSADAESLRGAAPDPAQRRRPDRCHPLQQPLDRAALARGRRSRRFLRRVPASFARLLREPRFQMRRHLGDGELVVFDNQRTLHGRTAFSSQRDLLAKMHL